MSRPVRLFRSTLSVPGSRPERFAKAIASDADIVIIDLEDAVAANDKASARAQVIAALRNTDRGAKPLAVRINGLDTPWWYRDLVDLVEQGGERLDLLMIPKINRPEDVYAVDVLVTQAARAAGRVKPFGYLLLIETAAGIANVEAIAAQAGPNAEAMYFGAGDYAASTGARTTVIGAPSLGYDFALARLVAAARAHGLQPIDGPYADVKDEPGLRAIAGKSAELGCEGKWAIHPAQIAPINEAFSPSTDELAQAERILDAMKQAAAIGQAAVTLDGRMIDVASIRQAEVVVRKARGV